MRTRWFLVLVAVALAAPLVTVSAAPSAGAAMVSGTPAWTVNSGGWNRSSSPTIADVNRDGRNDIVIGHENGLLHVINAANGQDLPGWPRQTGTAIDSTAAVGDLTRDGSREIVVGLGSTFVPNQQGGVKIYNANGTQRCVYRTQDYFNMWTNNANPDGYADGVYSSPAIGDITGDGYPDVVFGGFDLHIHAIDRNCRQVMSVNMEDTVWSSPALFDINGDGRLEILIGGDQSAGGAISLAGGEFRAIEYTAASTVACWHCRELWKHQLRDTMWSSPAVGDIDGDGRPEVVVGGGHYYNHPDGRKVYAWHVDDGSALRGWPVATSGSTMPSPALGDLNGNGIPEVVVASADGYVRAYNGFAQLKWAKALWHFSPDRKGGPVASPIIADMNGDGQNDVGAGNDFGYFVLSGATGSILALIDGYQSHDGAAAVGNFGSGVGWRLVVHGFNTPNKTSRLQSFPMPAPGKTPPWPMFRRDSLHHAGPVALRLLPAGQCRVGSNPKAKPSSKSSRGYWVTAADGSVYALKGAPFHGSAAGKIKGTAVAMAATRSGNGYYLLDNSGGIFPFGDARSFGSMTGFHLNKPIIALAPTPSGRGYWLMASDGGVFSFGDARFRGSTGNLRLSSPVLSMATAPSGAGYWLVAGDGGIFSFGVPFYGSVPGIGLCKSVPGVQIRPTLTGKGYFVLALNGRVFAFGDALGGASAPALGGWSFAADFAVRP